MNYYVILIYQSVISIVFIILIHFSETELELTKKLDDVVSSIIEYFFQPSLNHLQSRLS